MAEKTGNGLDIGSVVEDVHSKGVAGAMVIQPEISGRQMKAVRDIKR